MADRDSRALSASGVVEGNLVLEPTGCVLNEQRESQEFEGTFVCKPENKEPRRLPGARTSMSEGQGGSDMAH